jgi:hypothetical protein
VNVIVKVEKFTILVKWSKSNPAKLNGGPGITGRIHPIIPAIIKIEPRIIRTISII